MSIAQKLNNPKQQKLIVYVLLCLYVASLVFLFPLLIDYLKTFFYLKKYQQDNNTNIPFFIVSFIAVYFVAFPFIAIKSANNRMSILFVRNFDSLKDKVKHFLRFFLLIVFYLSFPLFVLYSFFEIASLKSSSQYYSDCRKIIESLKNSNALDNLNVYIEHTPFLFWNTKNIRSRILPLENSVNNIKDLLILTDSQNEYFYLFREGLLFSKISKDVGIYSNSASAMNFLKKEGYLFSNRFTLEKDISLYVIAKQNNVDNRDEDYIELHRNIPVIYYDQYLYTSGSYNICFEFKNIENNYDIEDAVQIEIHLGRIIKKEVLKANSIHNNRINIKIPVTVNKLEQGTFISIVTNVNSKILLNSVKIIKG